MGRAILLACCLLFGCDKQMLGLPRVAVSATSPDGSSVALVRNHPTIDGPSQSIWLSDRQLQRLGGDSDWCNTIVWSADSSTVAYLIQDARLVIADRASGEVVSEQWLVERDGCPTSRMVTNLSLSPDGREFSFRDCPRPGRGRRPDDCSERILPIHTGS